MAVGLPNLTTRKSLHIVNFKVIIFSLFVTAFSIRPALANHLRHGAIMAMQIEKPVENKTADTTKNKASGAIGLKKHAHLFFSAFGKLFEPKKKAKAKSKRLSGKSKKIPDVDTNLKTKEIFGFYPYWLNDSVQTYNYRLLSSIAYFGYDLDPYTGKSSYSKQWKSTQLIDTAKAWHTKVYLTVTSLSEKNNRVFLDTVKAAKAAQEKSINTMLQMLNDREAYGVTVYFEDVPCEFKNQYTNYIRNLSNRLKEFNKKVVIVLPGLDANECFDVVALDAYVEYFIVTADDYYGSHSDVAGPVAPLHGGNLWTQGNLENTIEEYLSQGIPKEKLIISLPFYGNKWETEDANVPTYTKTFLGKLTFTDIQKNYTQKVYFDPESQTKYLNYKQGKKFIQIWFDDARSMAKKYDFINTEQLAGVGIWALANDDGSAELWEVLHSKFKQTKAFKPKAAEKPLTWVAIFKKEGVLKGLLWVFAIVFMVGFLLSLRNIEVRDIVFTGSLVKNLILFGIPLLLCIAIYFLLDNKLWAIMVFIGILFGYGFYTLLLRTEQTINNANRIP